MSGRGETLGAGASKKARVLPMSGKMGLRFSARRIARLLEARKHQFSARAAVFLAAVLDVLAAEVLEQAGNAASDRIRPSHIRLAAMSDEGLSKLFGDIARNNEKMSKLLGDVTIANGGVVDELSKHLGDITSPESRVVVELSKFFTNVSMEELG